MDIHELFESQGGKCSVTGVLMSFEPGALNSACLVGDVLVCDGVAALLDSFSQVEVLDFLRSIRASMSWGISVVGGTCINSTDKWSGSVGECALRGLADTWAERERSGTVHFSADCFITSNGVCSLEIRMSGASICRIDETDGELLLCRTRYSPGWFTGCWSLDDPNSLDRVDELVWRDLTLHSRGELYDISILPVT